MLYTSRGQFREYDLLVRQLPGYVRSRFISQDDLFAGRWRDALDELTAAACRRSMQTRWPRTAREVVARLLRGLQSMLLGHAALGQRSALSDACAAPRQDERRRKVPKHGRARRRAAESCVDLAPKGRGAAAACSACRY